MRTVGEYLKFAIEFNYMDLEQLRPGDWLNLLDDVAAFLGLRTVRGESDVYRRAQLVGFSPWPVSGPLSVTASEVRSLQPEVRQFFNAQLNYQEDLDSKQRGEWTEREDPSLSPEIRARVWVRGPRDHGETTVLLAEGRMRDLFLLTLVFLLGRDATHVRRCPECGTIFCRVRKQQYCNRTCTNKANMQSWRQRTIDQATESALNHDRYTARVQRKHGATAKIKVTRRPRVTNKKGGNTDAQKTRKP